MKLNYTVAFGGVGIYAGIVIHISVAASSEEIAKRIAWTTLARGMKVPLDGFEVGRVVPYLGEDSHEADQGRPCEAAGDPL